MTTVMAYFDATNALMAFVAAAVVYFCLIAVLNVMLVYFVAYMKSVVEYL